MTKKILLGIVFTIFALGALAVRLPPMMKEFDQAEILHNYTVANANSIKDFSEPLIGQMQPAFEYMLRAFVWKPLLGNHERSMRIPGLIYSLITMALLFFAGFSYFKKRSNFNDALMQSLVVFIFYAVYRNDLTLISNGRHYGFMLMLSVAYCLTFFLRENFKDRDFYILSFVFLNTSFLALPLVAFFFLLQAVQKRKLKYLGIFPVMLGVTIWLNHGAWNGLRSFKTDMRPWGVIVQDVQQIYLNYFAHFNGLFFGLIPFLILLTMKKRRDMYVVLAQLFIFAFIFYSRLRTDYAYSYRYFACYEGLYFTALIVGIGYVSEFLKNKLKNSYSVSIFMCMLMLALGFPSFVGEVKAVVQHPPKLGVNFSNYYKAYRKIKERELPVIIIDDCYAAEFAPYYFKYTPPIHADGFFSADSRGCWWPIEKDRIGMNGFIERHPKLLVVLDKKESKCSDKTERKSGHITIKHAGIEDECLWLIEGVQKLGDIKIAADIVGFKYGKGLFDEFDLVHGKNTHLEK